MASLSSEVVHLKPGEVAAASRSKPLLERQVGFAVEFEPLGSDDGPEGWTDGSGGWSTWTAVIEADGAQALRLHAQDVYLPAGWTIRFEDKSGRIERIFDAHDVSRWGSDIWSAPIVGQVAVLRLSGPSGTSERPRATIADASYFYRGFGVDDRDVLLPCQIDVKCVTVNNPSRNAVGRMLYRIDTGAELLASCVVMADTLPDDRKAYVYTIGDLGEDDVSHASILIYWRYISTFCNFSPPLSPASNQGASVLAHSTERDFTLLQLWEPLPEIGAPTGAAFTDQPPTGILHAFHHPTGWSMRYATGSIEPPAAQCPEFPDSNFIFHDFDSGAMQPGSEGGAVFDADWNLVGVLTGTCAEEGVVPDCDNHAQVSVVTSRLAPALPNMMTWLNNDPFLPDEYEPNDTFEEAAPIVEGTYDLTLLHDSIDFFRFTPDCSGQLTFTFDYAEAHIALRTEIRDAQNQTIEQTTSTDNGHMEISVSASAGQTYYLRAFLADGDGGPYRMSVLLDRDAGVRSISAEFDARPNEPYEPFWSTATYQRDWFVGTSESSLAGTRAGAVYVYRRVSDGSWCLAQVLTPDPPLDEGGFGGSLATSSDGRLLVGAPGAISGLGTRPGKVYLFERFDGLWEQRQILTAPEPRDGDLFGRELSIDGQYAAIGAPGDMVNGPHTGAAYIFGTFASPDGQTWIEQSRIDSLDVGWEPQLGQSVLISGTTAFVGATGYNGGRGAVAVVKRRPVYTWEVDQVVESFEGVRSGMGGSLWRSGDQLFAGNGALHVLQLFTGQWWYIGTVSEVGDDSSNSYASSLVGFGDEVAVGYPGAQRVYKYRQVQYDVPVKTEAIQHSTLIPGQMGFTLATDGQALIIDTKYTGSWDDDCNGDGTPDHCQLISGELADWNGNGIPDDCEQAPCPADLALPQGVLDFFDVQRFLEYFSADDPRADLAPPYCTLDFFDILNYLNAFSAGCE